MITDPPDGDARSDAGPALRPGAMPSIDAVLFATFKDGMFGDDSTEIQDADQVGLSLSFMEFPFF